MGITPAYAGNTAYRGKLTHAIRDHPRLRGEHSDNEKRQTDRAGSPPPTRGTHTVGWSFSDLAGITPAYAGNTVALKKHLINSEDHPRLRGEHLVT